MKKAKESGKPFVDREQTAAITDRWSECRLDEIGENYENFKAKVCHTRPI